MPITKGKGGSASQRYRPAAQYDDATLAQKREYWRTKKREQRARLSERRGRPAQGGRAALSASAEVISSLSPMRSNDEACKTAHGSPAPWSGNAAAGSSPEATVSQKERWLQTMKLNKTSPQMPASRSISAKAAGDHKGAAKCRAERGAVSGASPAPSGTQHNPSSSVPPVRVTRVTNGSSAKTTPQPPVSMQVTSVPKMPHNAPLASRVQPKPSPSDGSAILGSSPCVSNARPQSGANSASAGAANSQPSAESEEERAARRREHWRIKKREQRAKLAARLARARDRTQGAEPTAPRQAGVVGGAARQHLLPSQPFLKGAGQRQCPARVRASFTPARRENNRLQSGAASLAAVNPQVNQIKVQNPHESRIRQMAAAPDLTSGKRPGKLLSYVHLSNVTRGIARCKTPRQRLIEAQKNFMNQRIIRCKSPLFTFGSRNIPRINPNDTPEQIIAKRREYWRVKKREQRAKLSLEVKARLKEKDSLMRRVKRYQMILEEMRRARALTQSAGSALTHASETIGGFIKEDGTVTIKIPRGPAAHDSEEEHRGGSGAAPITHHQPKRTGVAPVRINPPPPLLRPAQVRVSFPLSGQSVNKPPKLVSVRLKAAPNSQPVPVPAAGQLTLTHPQSPQNAVPGGSAAGSNRGGCVMKMAVSSAAPSPSALSLDPELSEEERMARKREYWRIKKREQRAARAARLKLGVLQARASAALQRRKAQKQAAVTAVPPTTGSAQAPPGDSVPDTPNANEIKQEMEPAVDLHSQPERAICPDIKPPTSPPAPPAPQPDSDPALSADSQATTLRAVASMKKLLEESLSTVRECKSEQADIKAEATDEAPEREAKPDLPQLFFGEDDVAPMAADLTLQIKSWQPDTEASPRAGSPGPRLKDAARVGEAPPPPPDPRPTCEHSSQTPLNFIVDTRTEASDAPRSPRRTQRLRTKKAGHQNCCSPEPPKLHHLPADPLRPTPPRAPQQAQVRCPNGSSASAQRLCGAGPEQGGLSSLQRKREYWKLMKRQQRARLKARQRERLGECSRQLSPANAQAPGLVSVNAVKGVNQVKPALQPKPSVAPPTAVVPTLLVVSPATRNAERPPDTLQVKLPVTSVSCSPAGEQNAINAGPAQIAPDCPGESAAPESQQQATPCSRKWTSRSTDEDSAPSLPALKPPDNPLSSINLQPIEPPAHPPSATLSPIKIPCSPPQDHRTHVMQSPAKLAPVTTMVPPKPIPGESEEDFLRRKREYWRIKKKEQRARKAIQDKGNASRRASNNWRPIIPAQELPTQDSGPWVSSSDESEHLMSTLVDTDLGSFPYSHYTAPVEDESELLFADYEHNNGEEGSVSDAVWRNSYLMDYDPLNQLLVCMVCGELQYSHSLEGVRAHIDDAHPDTLLLEPGERQRILEAWDEQVSRRERFFTSQLQQHSGSLAEAHRN